MAWVSPRVYAILSKSEEGKDILEGIADKDQDQVNKELDEFFGKGGKGYKSNAEYSQAKIDDEAEQSHIDDVDYDEDYERSWGPKDDDDDEDEEDDNGSKYLDKTWDDYFNKQKGWEKQENGRYDFGDDINYGSVNNDGEEQGKLTATRVRNGKHDNPEKKFFDDPQEAKEWVEEQSEPKKLDDIIKERSTFTKDKDYDAYSFKKELEENGHKVEYIENRSGTWQNGKGNEKYKEYDIKLEGGQHIYFKLIADENYDTKEIIAYKNGKNW